MASTYSRSSRRSEGLSTRSSTRNNVAMTPVDLNSGSRQQQSNIGRKKRPRDSLDDHEPHMKAKRTRITIELTPRSQVKPGKRSIVIRDARSTDAVPAGLRNTSPPPERDDTLTQIEPSPPAHLSAQLPAAHVQKAVNGIKHELVLLQPNPADLVAKDVKRKLRSQECTRFKSELSAYFPDYDEVIGNDPKEDDILEIDTPIIITSHVKTSMKLHPSNDDPLNKYPIKKFFASAQKEFHNAQLVDYSFIDKNYKEEGGEDPLSDAYFEVTHRKPDRQEKAIRNMDKGRAQHEKDQVIRLLEGLQGHDWLKLMGVSGVTDSKKKEFEPAREHFIKGCEAILEKFRTWKNEEKRRKLKKEMAQAAAEAQALEQDVEIDDALSDGDPPDYSDVDASAARQLHEEAIARSAPSKHGRGKVERTVPVMEEPGKEFTSFFPKPHLRAAALGKNRRSNRSVSAWGHPMPDIVKADFDLPEEYRDEETLRIRARSRRRTRRVCKK